MIITVQKTKEGIKRSMQTTLDDLFSNKVMSLEEHVALNMAKDELKQEIETKLISIDENNHMEYVNPVCPKGS